MFQKQAMTPPPHTLTKLLLTKIIAVPLLCLFTISCGDGDSGNSGNSGDGGANNSNNVTTDKIYLWLTTDTLDGNLGGVSGADDECAADTAKTASLPSGFTFTHKAVIANTSSYDPETIIPTSDTRSIYRPDGTTLIANSWQEYFTASTPLSNKVTAPSTDYYWTGTEVSGNPSAGLPCDGWTDGTNAYNSTTGNAGAPTHNKRYLFFDDQVTCDGIYRLLCVSY